MISLVLVSHSAKIAEGVRDLAAAMAPDVHIEVAGGTMDGGLGTAFDLVEEAGERALKASGGQGVVFLTDLGSANLTVDTVLEFADYPPEMVLAEGPIVEGAVAAAVAAQLGLSLPDVVAAVGASCQHAPAPEDVEADFEGTAVVADHEGLHARPAAYLARQAAGYDAEVFVNGVRATSAMEVMTLGVPSAAKVTVKAVGPQARLAVEEIVAAIEAGYDHL